MSQAASTAWSLVFGGALGSSRCCSTPGECPRAESHQCCGKSLPPSCPARALRSLAERKAVLVRAARQQFQGPHHPGISSSPKKLEWKYQSSTSASCSNASSKGLLQHLQMLRNQGARGKHPWGKQSQQVTGPCPLGRAGVEERWPAQTSCHPFVLLQWLSPCPGEEGSSKSSSCGSQVNALL